MSVTVPNYYQFKFASHCVSTSLFRPVLCIIDKGWWLSPQILDMWLVQKHLPCDCYTNISKVAGIQIFSIPTMPWWPNISHLTGIQTLAMWLVYKYKPCDWYTNISHVTGKQTLAIWLVQKHWSCDWQTNVSQITGHIQPCDWHTNINSVTGTQTFTMWLVHKH